MEITLRAAGVVVGSEVVVPTFCCTGVILPVLAVGATPVLTDVGDDLNITVKNVASAISQRTHAVIVPHMFGNPARIDDIVSFCDTKQIAVIDDAAQAMGATLKGRPAGTFGVAGVISFGKGKICFGLGGGGRIENAPLDASELEYQKLIISSQKKCIQDVATTLFQRCWRRWTLPIHMMASKIYHPVDPSVMPYSKHVIRNVDSAVALSLFSKIDRQIAERRARVKVYQNLLGNNPAIKLFPHAYGSACTSQVVQLRPGSQNSNNSAKLLITHMQKHGYEIDSSYTPLHHQSDFRKFGSGEFKMKNLEGFLNCLASPVFP